MRLYIKYLETHGLLYLLLLHDLHNGNIVSTPRHCDTLLMTGIGSHVLDHSLLYDASCREFTILYTAMCAFNLHLNSKTKAGNLLIRSSLMSLKSIEQLWAIRSDRWRQMSDCERIAQVTQDKWMTVSESLRSLMTNEQSWAILSGCSW